MALPKIDLSKYPKCPSCQGTGRQTVVRSTPGLVSARMESRPCRKCSGIGRVLREVDE